MKSKVKQSFMNHENNKNPWKLRVSKGAFLDRGLFLQRLFILLKGEKNEV